MRNLFVSAVIATSVSAISPALAALPVSAKPAPDNEITAASCVVASGQLKARSALVTHWSASKSYAVTCGSQILEIKAAGRVADGFHKALNVRLASKDQTASLQPDLSRYNSDVRSFILEQPVRPNTPPRTGSPRGLVHPATNVPVAPNACKNSLKPSGC